MATDLIHGSAVSYQAEHRANSGEYGILYSATPAMLYPGLSTSFSVDVEESYEEISYTPSHGENHSLECVRNVNTGENLPFDLSSHPQVTGDWPLLEFITGSNAGLGDEPDSTSWLKELNGKFSLFTGIMFEDYKCEIPGVGVAKEDISGFAGHRVAISGISPATTEATENTSEPLVWNDISSIRMGPSGGPLTTITHCFSDMSYGFTSEIEKTLHPESELTTKICDVKVKARKMFVSLKLTWVDQTFIDVVTTSEKLNLKMIIGQSGHQTTMQFNGLYWPKYIAKAEPKELIGDTITCITDQPSFTYSTA